jgi:hypothetical protein
MICEELARDACPCILADIGHCRCCSLLMGKEFCQCDYPGVCVYEKHRWEEVQPLGEHDQVVACFPYPTCTGIVVQWANSANALPGLLLTLRQTGREAVCGTVLHTYPEKKLVYLAVTSHMPALATSAPVEIETGRNVFGRDAIHVANPAGQSVQIIADNDLLPLLTVLANGFKQHASVVLTEIKENRPNPRADLLIFISRDHIALRQALKGIPLYSKTHSAFWFVT